MQAAFLISAKGFTEKELGVLFFVFGMSQFLCMAPAGYLLDYSNNKIKWVIYAGFTASAITIVTALVASLGGDNMGIMILLKIIQGGATAILPPGFNGITLGIVGSSGFTHQVSRNRMMNHIGTALVVAIGSLIAYFLYPNIGVLFIVSPIAAIGMYYNLVRIKPNHVNRDAARGLIIESPTMTEYEQMDENASVAHSGAVWQTMSGEQSELTDENDSGGNEMFQYQQHIDPLNTVNESYLPPDVLSEDLKDPALMTAPRNSEFRPTDPTISQSKISTQTGHPPPTIDEHRPIDYAHEHSLHSRPGTAILSREASQTSKTSSQGRSYGSQPSFNFGWSGQRNRLSEAEDAAANYALENEEEKPRRARTPFSVLLDPTLATFTLVVFFFHLANSSVLPLVMQSLALQDAQAGILLSGLCILIAQGFMAYFAKLSGDYSPKWGRKNITLVGLASLTLRCFLLTVLLSAQTEVETDQGRFIIKGLILSTQILDSVGAGIFGTLHILVTNDISGGTGRFSLMLGVTTGAMCLGGTVSGYIGQAIAQDYGYPFAFTSLGILSLVPFFLYVFFMPETLPDYVKPKSRRKRLAGLLKRLNEHRQAIAKKANPFRRKSTDDSFEVTAHSEMMNERLHNDNMNDHILSPRSATVELV